MDHQGEVRKIDRDKVRNPVLEQFSGSGPTESGRFLLGDAVSFLKRVETDRRMASVTPKLKSVLVSPFALNNEPTHRAPGECSYPSDPHPQITQK